MQLTGSNFISIYADENAEETPKEWTPAQLAQRRKWAQIVCKAAVNETSRRMAKRLCASWFKDCHACEVQQN